MDLADRNARLQWDLTGALDGFRVWLDGDPIGPTHPTFTRAVTAKAYLMADAHDALAQLAATLAKPRSQEII
jgi:hypothetical protein